jgi:hypothetical protein
MWGQLSSLTATLVEKANELVDEVGQDAAAAAQQLVRGALSAAEQADAAAHGRSPVAAPLLPRRRLRSPLTTLLPTRPGLAPCCILQLQSQARHQVGALLQAPPQVCSQPIKVLGTGGQWR